MKTKGPITTHILDTSTGKPASALKVVLEVKDKDRWTVLSRGTSDAEGRVNALLPPDHGLTIGTYRLTFEVGTAGFFPEVSIAFRVDDPEQHYHVPLLLSPFGYSTYRGS